MAVGANDDVSGEHQALFGQQRVFDAHSSDFVIMDQLLFQGKFPDQLGLHGRGNVLVGDEMIGDEGHPFTVEDFPGARFAKGFNRQGRRNIVSQGEIQRDFDQFSRVQVRSAGMSCQDFFTNGHCHLVAFHSMAEGLHPHRKSRIRLRASRLILRLLFVAGRIRGALRLFASQTAVALDQVFERTRNHIAQEECEQHRAGTHRHHRHQQDHDEENRHGFRLYERQIFETVVRDRTHHQEPEEVREHQQWDSQ